MSIDKAFYKERIYPLVFMFITTFLCILLTAGVHLLTEEKAKANELSFTRKAVLDAAGISYTDTTDGIEKAYLSSVQEHEGYFTAENRYIIPLEGPGLWGTISLMVGFETDLETISGIAIVSQNETPGLGARIEEPWFTAQFKGRKTPLVLVEEGTASQPDQIDSITGATRTSQYFRNLANKASGEAKRIIGGV